MWVLIASDGLEPGRTRLLIDTVERDRKSQRMGKGVSTSDQEPTARFALVWLAPNEATEI